MHITYKKGVITFKMKSNAKLRSTSCYGKKHKACHPNKKSPSLNTYIVHDVYTVKKLYIFSNKNQTRQRVREHMYQIHEYIAGFTHFNGSHEQTDCMSQSFEILFV